MTADQERGPTAIKLGAPSALKNLQLSREDYWGGREQSRIGMMLAQHASESDEGISIDRRTTLKNGGMLSNRSSGVPAHPLLCSTLEAYRLSHHTAADGRLLLPNPAIEARL